MSFGEPMPWAAMRWILADEHPGWTLEYIDNLDLKDIVERAEVRKGQAHHDKMKKKAK